ncbi:hypothetical protein NZK33_17350, partial [Cyanobium sp. FGCU-6]|nr:hypothetical protein [Cyanobium sp. FGCU6]
GNDTITGSGVADRIRGGRDADTLDGKGGSDTYEVTGAGPEWVSGVPYTFEGFDTYRDSGGTGDVDRIVATGTGAVDVGLSTFGATSGIEQIVNGTEDGALVRLLGDWKANALDFSRVTFVGPNFQLDGGDGNDTITGSGVADRIRGGRGVDVVAGNAGADVITGGLDMDVLSGGADADIFTYTDLVDALWTGGGTVERISDFVVGIDQFDLGIVPSEIRTLGVASGLDCAAISVLLNLMDFAANGAATFLTIASSGTTRTFIGFNDANAGFDPATDALVEITGYTFANGATSLSQITLV